MWLIEVGLEFEPKPAARDLSPLVIAAYNELRADTGVCQPEFSGCLGLGEITFEMRLVDDDRERALRCATAAVRTALHAAGAATSGWEERLEELIDGLLERASTSAELVGAAAVRQPT